MRLRVRKAENSYDEEAGQTVVRSLEKVLCGGGGGFFEVSGPFEKRKHGGSYVFNYFAYIVTLLRLWFSLVFFVVVSPTPFCQVALILLLCLPSYIPVLSGL